MRAYVVLTLNGPDRVGIVEEVTAILLDLDGNVEASRMARLGGEFAILMLVSFPDCIPALETAFAALTAEGYALTVGPALWEPPASHEGWKAFRVEVEGADHEGIIHDVAAGLSHRGITIESADTATSEAAVSGLPLFSMTALVLVPPDASDAEWRADLAEAASRSNVDITVTPAGGEQA